MMRRMTWTETQLSGMERSQAERYLSSILFCVSWSNFSFSAMVMIMAGEVGQPRPWQTMGFSFRRAAQVSNLTRQNVKSVHPSRSTGHSFMSGQMSSSFKFRGVFVSKDDSVMEG